jgi:hypothetical protein
MFDKDYRDKIISSEIKELLDSVENFLTTKEQFVEEFKNAWLGASGNN